MSVENDPPKSISRLILHISKVKNLGRTVTVVHTLRIRLSTTLPNQDETKP